jgi:outer membrane protein, heavy metal efflux system
MRIHPRTIVTNKRPIFSRCLMIALVAVVPLRANGAEIDEHEAIALGLDSEAFRDATEGPVLQAEADVERARRRPNPVANYQREQTDGEDDVTENYAWLSQTVDLAGRRSTRGDAADERLGAAQASSESLTQARRAEIKERFYDVLLAERRVAALANWLSSGTRIARIIERREKAGEVSAYDRRRLEREQASAGARVAVEQAASERAKERLRAVIGESTSSGNRWTKVVGSLLPAGSLPPSFLQALYRRSSPSWPTRRSGPTSRRFEPSSAPPSWMQALPGGGGFRT